MICLHPICVNGIKYPCGKCPVCVHNAREALANRFLLESQHSVSTYFLTLTYNDDCLPHYYGIPCFDKKQVQSFIKRLRNDIPKFKMFLTSEFGDRTGRPHYHMLLFMHGYAPLQFVRDAVAKQWKFGNITITTANQRRFAYCAKYCLKENYDEFKSLPNDCPLKPFRLWSLRPGIGSSALNYVNEFIHNSGMIRYDLTQDGKKLKLDNYMKRHIDPSLRAEMKFHNYDSNFAEIQERLTSSFVNHSREVFDFLQNKYIFVPDDFEDNKIKKHRQQLKNLKKNLL